MSSPFVDPTVLSATITSSDGVVVHLRHVPVTRSIRDLAFEKAVLAYRQLYPGDKTGSYIPSVFEREIVLACVKEWSLDKPILIGWDLLDMNSDLGEKISEAVGVEAARKSFSGNSKEVQEAKN